MKQNIIFFDTETTGVPRNYNLPPSADLNNWPRLVQIGWIVYNNGIFSGSREYIIKPDGFEIPQEASRVHGVTQEIAMEQGVDLKELLKDFWKNWVSPSDIIVGHNVSFDLNVVGSEYYRMFGINPLEGRDYICTMKHGTDFCKIPGPRGNKWPKLYELYQKLFDKPLNQSHTALDDIENTAQCYFAMVEREIIK